MEKQLKDIQDEYDELMRQPRQTRRSWQSQRNDIRDITAMRDRLIGTYKMPDDPGSFFVRAGERCVMSTL
jgi:hypothetical protein